MPLPPRVPENGYSREPDLYLDNPREPKPDNYDILYAPQTELPKSPMRSPRHSEQSYSPRHRSPLRVRPPTPERMHILPHTTGAKVKYEDLRHEYLTD